MKEGWKYLKLGEVCEKASNIKWTDIKEDISYKYIDLSSVDRNTLSITEPQIIDKDNAPSRAKQIVKFGDIIFATTRPTLRRICKINGDFDGQICSTGFCVLRPKRDVLTDWIFYNLVYDGFYQYIEPLQTGANYPAVTDGSVKSFLISLPPLPEQQRIVEYLDTQFAKIDALKANAAQQLQAAKDLFQSALKDLMTPKDGWEEKSIKDIALLKAGKTLNKKDVIDNCKQGYYPVYGGNGQRGFVPYYNQDGEFNIIGRQGALCGNINIARGKFYATEHAVLVHPIIDVDFKFLNYALIKANINQYATGSAQPGISVANINNLLFLHIPPFAEQQQIANKLDSLSAKVKALQTNYTETITLCNDLKQSLLKQIFE